MRDITRHNITEYFSDLYAIKHDPHQTEASEQRPGQAVCFIHCR